MCVNALHVMKIYFLVHHNSLLLYHKPLILCFQDVQYADIDHMQERMDFTVDNINFKGLPKYFEQLRQDGMRTIIILVIFFIFFIIIYYNLFYNNLSV